MNSQRVEAAVAGSALGASMTADEFRASFPITMLGPRGVGKTSMLAAIKHEFGRVCRDVDLQLIPDPQTEVALNAAHRDLLRMCECRKGEYPRPTVPPTTEPRSYTLDLYHVPSKSGMSLAFHDYPGGWITDPTHIREAGRLLSRAAVILIALDAPALMELHSSAHDDINLPENIADRLKHALRDDESDWGERLVIFVPMRAERWLQDGHSARLYERFTQRFAPALKALQAYKSRTCVVYCPIQTLGAVEFSSFQTDGEGGPRAQFRKVRESYAPQDCDQPLRYSLLYILNSMRSDADQRAKRFEDSISERSTMERLWNWTKCLLGGEDVDQRQLDEWLGRSSELLDTAEEFARDCKRDVPVRVLHNPHSLLGTD